MIRGFWNHSLLDRVIHCPGPTENENPPDLTMRDIALRGPGVEAVFQMIQIHSAGGRVGGDVEHFGPARIVLLLALLVDFAKNASVLTTEGTGSHLSPRRLLPKVRSAVRPSRISTFRVKLCHCGRR